LGVVTFYTDTHARAYAIGATGLISNVRIVESFAKFDFRTRTLIGGFVLIQSISRLGADASLSNRAWWKKLDFAVAALLEKFVECRFSGFAWQGYLL